jgi:transcriptional regulator with XRE-family HTH domain
MMVEKKYDNKVVSRIAKKIKSTRLEKKLTIQQLATRTQVSKGLLSKIENSRTIPSLPVFVTLIKSLDISLKDFFHDIGLFNGKGYLVIRTDEHSPLEDTGVLGFSGSQLLSQHTPGHTFQISLLRIEPGADGIPITTDGFVFHYILQGVCTYQIQGEISSLGVGDAIYFDGASTPRIATPPGAKAEVLSVQFGTTK